MYEELPLHIYQLPMGYPCNYLINKHLLALFQDNLNPIFQPKWTFLIALPKYVNNNSSSIFLIDNFSDNIIELFHNHMIGWQFSFDIAKSKMFTLQKIPLNTQNQILIFLQTYFQPLRNSFTIQWRIFSHISKRYLSHFHIYKLHQFMIIITYLHHWIYHRRFWGSKNSSRWIDTKAIWVSFYYWSGFAQQG